MAFMMNGLHHRFLLVSSVLFALASQSLDGVCQETPEEVSEIDSEISQLEKKRASEYAFALRLLVQKKDYARAAELATLALIIAPSDPKDAARLRALAADVALGLLREEKSPKRAVSLCEKAVETFTDDAIFLYIASLAYRELGDEARQKEFEAKVKAIKPDDQAYWFNIASHLRRKVGLKAACDLFEIVATISSDDPTHYNADSEAAMAQIWCALGDYEQALRHCENLREIARRIVVSRTDIALLTAAVYAERARELEIEEKYEEAIEDYKKSAEFSPQPGGAYALIGELYLKLKDYEEAEKWLRHALSAGAMPLAYAGLGDVQKALSNTEEAEKQYAKAEKAFTDEIDKSPNEALNYNNLAWFYATHDRELDKGIKLAKKAIELDPKTAAYLDTLAELYYRKGDCEPAIEEIKKAIALDPPHIRYFQNQLRRFQDEGR